MKCRVCGYSLEGLSTRVCPECSTTFDPADPLTLAPTDRERFWNKPEFYATVSAAVPWTLLVSTHGMLVTARMVLGRWPNRMGMDDPKGIQGLWPLHVVAFIAFLALMPSAFTTMVSAIAIVAKRGMSTGLKWALWLIASWVVAWTILRQDPAQAFVWFMD